MSENHVGSFIERNIWFLLASILLFLSLTLFQAQRAMAQETVRFGIGVGVSPLAIAGDVESKFTAGGFENFYFPIQIGPYIKVEPEIGLYFFTTDQTVQDSSGSVIEHTARQIVRTGIGVFYTWRPDSVFTMYLGGRTGILSSERQITHSRQSSIANFDRNWAVYYAGAGLGAEYFFSHHFSLGAELQLTHFGFGVPVIKSDPNPTEDFTQNATSTNTVLFARFYF